MQDGPQNGLMHAPRNTNRQGGTKTDAGLYGSNGAVQSVLHVEMPNGR
jgi:hypothetical protein